MNIHGKTFGSLIQVPEGLIEKLPHIQSVIEAGKEISLKCGKAEIILKENGDITLKGKDIVNKTKSKFAVKASGSVSFKGSSVKDN